MRPVSSRRNTAQYPLDYILGSEAQVRLIRVILNEVEYPLGVSHLATLSGLTPQWARKALSRLVECGLLLRIGGGRALKFGLRDKHPLIDSLRLLFKAEERSFDALISALRTTLLDVHEIRRAWIKRMPMDNRDSLVIAVEAKAIELGWIGHEIRSRLIAAEKKFDLIVEVEIFTRADAPDPDPDAVFLVIREETIPSAARRNALTHQEEEERSFLLAKGIARLIRTSPSLITRAKNHLNRLMHEDHGPAGGDIAEWSQLLETYSMERVAQLLESRTSRADRLRQSLPFFAVLNAQEREQLLSSVRDSA